MNKLSVLFFSMLLISSCNFNMEIKEKIGWFFLPQKQMAEKTYHTDHYKLYAQYAPGYNKSILKGIDIVQSTANDGGGYFIGIDSIPTESPIGYELKLLGKSLLDPPRTTSYCSGSSYGAFIEGLNDIYKDSAKEMPQAQFEASRMQEPDGGRREDHIKLWGWWNADGYGNHFALVQYTKMGERITPKEARPGDFLNISWKSGVGHSVVFLGWYKDEAGKKYLLYWNTLS